MNCIVLWFAANVGLFRGLRDGMLSGWSCFDGAVLVQCDGACSASGCHVFVKQAPAVVVFIFVCCQNLVFVLNVKTPSLKFF